MTRLAIVGDSHFDETSRFAECISVHEWIAGDLRERGVDLLLHSGDVFERKSTPRERNAVAAWLASVAAHCPAVLVRGNHDVPGDLRIFGRIAARHAITVQEAAGVHFVRAGNGELVQVAALSWPRTAELLARLGNASKPEGEQAAAFALTNVLRGLGAEMNDEAPRVCLAHVMVRGSETSTGQPLVGVDLELGLDDLALVRAHLYALGHVHMPQEWTISGAPALYPGSPRRTAFGEIETKGYIIAEFDGLELMHVERVPTPCAGMLLYEDEWGLEPVEGHAGPGWRAGLHGHRSIEEVRGAEIRFRYYVAPDRRAEARAAAKKIEEELLALGAVYVKLDEQIQIETRARSIEIAKALTLDEKLEALWKAKRFEPGERREPMLAKVRLVEDEIRNAG